MDTRRWRNLGIVLALLAALFVLTQVRESGHTVRATAVFDLEPDEVGRIVISEGDQRSELLRLDTLWVLAGHETEQLRSWRLDAFFNSVLSVERESLISENPAKWSTYGVDSTGRQLQVYNRKGELQSHLVVGRSTVNWQSSYLRAIGEDQVYQTRQGIYQFIAAGAEFWLEPPPPEPDTTGAGEQ